MTITVKLRATSEDGSEAHDLELTFDEADLAVLTQYLNNFDRMTGARIFTAGFPMVKKIKWTPASGLVFEVSEFDYGHVCELLHVARPRWPPQTAPLMAGQTAPGRTVGL